MNPLIQQLLLRMMGPAQVPQHGHDIQLPTEGARDPRLPKLVDKGQPPVVQQVADRPPVQNPLGNFMKLKNQLP